MKATAAAQLQQLQAVTGKDSIQVIRDEWAILNFDDQEIGFELAVLRRAARNVHARRPSAAETGNRDGGQRDVRILDVPLFGDDARELVEEVDGIPRRAGKELIQLRVRRVLRVDGRRDRSGGDDTQHGRAERETHGANSIRNR